MKVKQLIEFLLETVDPEATIVIAAGSEFQPARALASDMNFFPEDADVAYPQLTPELKRQGYTEEDVRDGGVPALVLWP